MKSRWVVLLEALGDDRSPVGHELLDRLVAEVDDCRPRLLRTAGRYAAQLELTTVTALEAHAVAVARWRDALRAVGAPEWTVVRAEVLTAAEFEHDCRAAEREEGLVDGLNVTERPDSLADQLLRDVFEDPLTRLPTAELFRAQVEQAVSRPQEHGLHHALVMLHLGVLTGPARPPPKGVHDLVLLEVVKRLTTVTRRGDTVAKLASDTLAVLVKGIGKEDAVALAQRALAAVSGSVRAAGGHVRLAGSVGVALSHAGYDDPDRLLAAAAAAMEAAKNDRGGRWELFRAGVAPPRSAGLCADATGPDGSADDG